MRSEQLQPGKSNELSRRDFIRRTGMLGALAMRGDVLAAAGSTPANSAKIAFNTANLVARVTNHRYELRNWICSGPTGPTPILTSIDLAISIPISELTVV
jgi:hypothetical protein